jgi:hypothetical protein
MADDLKRPFFDASFLARVVREPSFGGGEKMRVANLFLEFVEVFGDGQVSSTRFGSFLFKAFGAAAERMEKDAVKEGEFIEIHGATLGSQKKFHDGQELQDEHGKPVFETVLLIDDTVGSYEHVFGRDDVDEPEKPKKEKAVGGRERGRSGGDRSSGDRSSGDSGSGSRRGSSQDRSSDRSAAAERGGSDRGNSGGGDRGNSRSSSSARSGGGSRR